MFFILISEVLNHVTILGMEGTFAQVCICLQVCYVMFVKDVAVRCV